MRIDPKWNGAIGAANILACIACAAGAEYAAAAFCAFAAAINLAIWKSSAI